MKIIKIDINKTPKRVPIKITQKEDTPFIDVLNSDEEMEDFLKVGENGFELPNNNEEE